MKIHNVIQGSEEWHALRAKHPTASEAPAMMGCSKYKTRDDLLALKVTGEDKPIDAHTQKLLDKGHETEAMARPLAEDIVGEELFPVTATDDDDYLLASYDGITLLEDVVYEHKLWSEPLAECVRNDKLDPYYYWQLEQQLLVSGAEHVVFVVSDGTAEKFEYMVYEPVPGRAEALLAGWAQFQKDLESYRPAEYIPAPEATPVKGLPAIRYQLNGLALTSNLDIFKAAAEALVDESKKTLATDQDFADRDNLIKVFKETEGKIKLIKEQVIGEIKDVDKFSKELGHIGELIRQARLNSEKQVTAKKKEIRAEIAGASEAQLTEHINEINRQLQPACLPANSSDFAGVIKGKKTLKSLHEAVNDELARVKIEIDAVALKMTGNLALLRDLAADYKFLFSDTAQIIMKDRDDLELLIKSRISDHKQAEEKRLDAERERIREEEEAKAEQKRLRLEREAKEKAETPAPTESQSVPQELQHVKSEPDVATESTLYADLHAWRNDYGISGPAYLALTEVLDKHVGREKAA